MYDGDVSTYDRVLDKGKFVSMMTTFQHMIEYLIRACIPNQNFERLLIKGSE